MKSLCREDGRVLLALRSGIRERLQAQGNSVSQKVIDAGSELAEESISAVRQNSSMNLEPCGRGRIPWRTRCK